MLRSLTYDQLDRHSPPAQCSGSSRLLDLRDRFTRHVQVALVRRAQAGDHAAFTRLWNRHVQLVHAILLSMVSDQEAEDLMQEVALSAWRALPRVGQPERFTPWLSTIARNLGRDALRRSQEPAAEQLEVASCDARVEAPEASLKLEADDVVNRIRLLPEPYREPLMLRLVLQLSAKEIAEQTGLTPGSVRVNLCRAMKLLRSAFDDGNTT